MRGRQRRGHGDVRRWCRGRGNADGGVVFFSLLDDVLATLEVVRPVEPNGAIGFHLIVGRADPLPSRPQIL